MATNSALSQPTFAERRLQMCDALLRISERRGLLRVLLGFEHHPAGITAQFLEDADIVDDAVARHGIDAEFGALAENRIEETPVAGARFFHFRLAHILAMDVADAGPVTPRQRGGVGAA